ncbi:hypothetical protein BJ165DRAFT_1491889 [Panaeolus papilionaceus]|nr:hypothetical protein BJ165DRAFT_1491889 [Panaeolus papilionaceus]
MESVHPIFLAIAQKDQDAVQSLLSEGFDLAQRDHLERTCLHIAILNNTVNIACDLIDAGARIAATLPNGIGPIHLAVFQNNVLVIQKLLQRSLSNSSAESAGKSLQPDVIDLNAPINDLGMTAYAYAILYGSPKTLDVLLSSGSSCLAINPKDLRPIHPLTLRIFRAEDNLACEIVTLFMHARNTSDNTSDASFQEAFHQLIRSGRASVVAAVLRCMADPARFLNTPWFSDRSANYPANTATNSGHHDVLAVLLAYGAKLYLEESDLASALDAAPRSVLKAEFGKNVEIPDDLFAMIHRPLEVALYQLDESAKLFIALSAPANVPIRWARRTCETQDNMLIMDYVKHALKNLDYQHQKEEDLIATTNLPSLAADGTSPWREYYQVFRDNHRSQDPSLTNTAITRQRAQQNQLKIGDTREFFAMIQHDLARIGAKKWEELYPDKPTTAHEREFYYSVPAYQHLGDHDTQYIYLAQPAYRSRKVPDDLTAACDELYEACYAGDNKRILKLCLPDTVTSGARPLPISLKMQDCDTKGYSHKEGYTPLFAAISAQKWSTARLVLAIAIPQCNPVDAQDRFNAQNYRGPTGEDSFDFLDIAARAFTPVTNLPPHYMLTDLTTPAVNAGSRTSLSLLCQAVRDKDVEAFTEIANLYDIFGKPISADRNVLDWILKSDYPDILDEFLRRTGLGIISPPKATARQKVEPDYPLLWKAILVKSEKLVAYLASDRPVAAYKFYSDNHPDNPVLWWLRETPPADWEKKIRPLLGWTINAIGDSPLTAAILSDNLAMVKLLEDKDPGLMADAFQVKIRYLEVSPFRLAVRNSASLEILEYLLAAVPDAINECDAVKGWNLYHELVDMNNRELTEYFLQKFPQAVNDRLLRQPSKSSRNTPLHIAAKRGSILIVGLFLQYLKQNQEALSVRDADGQTPLIAAVKAGYPQITRDLLAASHNFLAEDAEGNTVLEVAIHADYTDHIKNYIGHLSAPEEIDPGAISSITHREYVGTSNVAEKAANLRKVVQHLLDHGVLKHPSKLVTELYNLAEYLERRAPIAQKAWVKPTPAVADPVLPESEAQQDRQDVHATLKVVQEALALTIMESTNEQRRIPLSADEWEYSQQAKLVKSSRIDAYLNEAFGGYYTSQINQLASSQDIEGWSSRSRSMVFQYCLFSCMRYDL